MRWESREKKSDNVTKPCVIDEARWKAEFEVKGEGKNIFVWHSSRKFGTCLEPGVHQVSPIDEVPVRRLFFSLISNAFAQENKS